MPTHRTDAQRRPRRHYVASTRVVMAATAIAAAALGLGVAGNHTARAESISARMVEPNANFRSWKFDPIAIAVAAGDTVVFTNAGGAAHTVTEQDKKFDSGNLDPGQTFTWKPAKAGTFTFFCTYHPWMAGTITVTGSFPEPDAATSTGRAAAGLVLWKILGVATIGGLAMAPAGGGLLLMGWLIYDAHHHAR